MVHTQNGTAFISKSISIQERLMVQRLWDGYYAGLMHGECHALDVWLHD